MSKLNSLLDAIVTAQGSVPGSGPVVKRALPKVEETIDPPQQTTVSGAELVDRCVRIAFGGKWRIVYQVDVTLITPSDRALEKGLVEHTDWREATRIRHEKVTGADGVELASSPMLEREKLAQGYNYTQVTLILTTYESRP